MHVPWYENWNELGALANPAACNCPTSVLNAVVALAGAVLIVSAVAYPSCQLAGIMGAVVLIASGMLFLQGEKCDCNCKRGGTMQGKCTSKNLTTPLGVARTQHPFEKPQKRPYSFLDEVYGVPQAVPLAGAQNRRPAFNNAMGNPLMFANPDPYNFRRPEMVTTDQSVSDLLYQDRTMDEFIFHPVPDPSLTDRGPNFIERMDYFNLGQYDKEADWWGGHPASRFKTGDHIGRGDSDGRSTYVGTAPLSDITSDISDPKHYVW